MLWDIIEGMRIGLGEVLSGVGAGATAFVGAGCGAPAEIAPDAHAEQVLSLESTHRTEIPAGGGWLNVTSQFIDYSSGKREVPQILEIRILRAIDANGSQPPNLVYDQTNRPEMLDTFRRAILDNDFGSMPVLRSGDTVIIRLQTDNRGDRSYNQHWNEVVQALMGRTGGAAKSPLVV